MSIRNNSITFYNHDGIRFYTLKFDRKNILVSNERYQCEEFQYDKLMEKLYSAMNEIFKGE